MRTFLGSSEAASCPPSPQRIPPSTLFPSPPLPPSLFLFLADSFPSLFSFFCPARFFPALPALIQCFGGGFTISLFGFFASTVRYLLSLSPELLPLYFVRVFPLTSGLKLQHPSLPHSPDPHPFFTSPRFRLTPSRSRPFTSFPPFPILICHLFPPRGVLFSFLFFLFFSQLLSGPDFFTFFPGLELSHT